MWSSVVEDASNLIAANGEIDADCTMTHDVPLQVAGEILGDATMCLIRGRSCRHNLLTLACPGRIRGTSSRRRDAGELSLLVDAHGTVAQREDSDGPAPIHRCRTRAAITSPGQWQRLQSSFLSAPNPASAIDT